MSWRDNLLPASFRGAPFKFEDSGLEGGRRLAEHEFPLREDAYVEDMGKRNRRYTLTGYVLGDDYMAARDALLAALEAEGEGTLNHPYLGPLTVNVDHVHLHETRAEGGMARFELEFLDAGSNPSPTSSEDTSNDSLDAGEDGFDQGEESFEEDWEPDAVQDYATSLLDQLEDALQVLVTWPGVDTSGIADLIENLSALVLDAAAIADAVRAFFSGYSDAVALVVNVPTDEAYSSRGPVINTDPSYGLATISLWGKELPEVAAPKAPCRRAMVLFIGMCGTAALAQVYARTTFPALDDAQSARDQLSGLIDVFIDAASSPLHDDAAQAALQALQTAAGNDLTVRGLRVPSTVIRQVNDAMPALTVAQRFYRDATRAGELVARNAAPHPLFLPPQVEVLTA